MMFSKHSKYMIIKSASTLYQSNHYIYNLYSQYLSLSEFSWHCPTCLFNVLPDENAFNDLDESMQQSQDVSHDASIPSTIEVLESAPNGLQLIHHNVQGLISKPTETAHWLHTCQLSSTILCCSEIWLKTDSFMLAVDGFEQFNSADLVIPVVFCQVPVCLCLLLSVLSSLACYL